MKDAIGTAGTHVWRRLYIHRRVLWEAFWWPPNSEANFAFEVETLTRDWIVGLKRVGDLKSDSKLFQS